ncbi:shikimate kinase [Rothia mucilaginosa ATCC 25296]|uniref:shikimate kinase n=1 Tax=Rothia mucilaginosa TaxID=43675 RepID=UPI0001B0F6E1|nr:shikimate kinase [Rothia mucilaginosa]EET75119.1 shikimate kinase [Rothia mucilaginosa ATCC 25296]
MPLPAESEGRGAKGRGSGEVSVEQGVRPVASSPLARIAAATQRARGGASPRPESGAESGVSEPGVPAAAEQSVEAAGAGAVEVAGAGVRETVAREATASVSSASVSSVRPASRVPTPADLMRSGARPLPAAATASTQGVRLYASSVSEDADQALGLDEDLRLKLLSALQGMGTAEEEPRKEPAKAEAPKPAAPKPAAPSVVAVPKPTVPKPTVPKPAAPKPAPPMQAQPAEAAGESATASAPVQKAEPQSAPAVPAIPATAPAHPVAVPAAEPAKPVRPTPALFGKVQVAAPAAPAAEEENQAGEKPLDASELPATPAESVAPAELTVPTELAAPAEALAEDESAGARIHPQQVREMHENFAERSRPIVLIGPMAAGKTYIGTHLARFYGYEFLDADQLIVERYGEVSEIFEIFGEAYFRELERKTIEEVLTSPVYRNTVFSLGGGAPMTDSVAELLKDECVVYILVDADTVTPRITGNKTRPLLQPNPVERWTEIFERRRSRYEELAHFTLDARGGRPITEMTAEIQAYVTATRASRAQRPQA